MNSASGFPAGPPGRAPPVLEGSTTPRSGPDGSVSSGSRGVVPAGPLGVADRARRLAAGGAAGRPPGGRGRDGRALHLPGPPVAPDRAHHGQRAAAVPGRRGTALARGPAARPGAPADRRHHRGRARLRRPRPGRPGLGAAHPLRKRRRDAGVERRAVHGGGTGVLVPGVRRDRGGVRPARGGVARHRGRAARASSTGRWSSSWSSAGRRATCCTTC